MTPAILHIPHASALIPPECRAQYLTDPERELPSMTDWFTDELFDAGIDRLVFPVSRLVCDPERFRDDREESMSRVGMGAVYTACHDLSPLRCVTEAERETLLQTWYDPHHAKLEAMVRTRLACFGHCLIVDCHSYSAQPLPYEKELPAFRPRICIGRDFFHTPSALSSHLLDAFTDLGYEAAFDSPYSGCMIPLRYYRKEKHVHGVMIEIRRDLYCDPPGVRNKNFLKLKRDLNTVLSGLRSDPFNG